MSAIADLPEPIAARGAARDNALVIHRAVREEILTGQLAPEAWISQVQIARRFGVSRGPVRKALRLLEREGLIEATTLNQRARVTAFSVEDPEQLYATRIVQEGQAITVSVPQFTPEEIGGLWARLESWTGSPATTAAAGTRFIERSTPSSSSTPAGESCSCSSTQSVNTGASTSPATREPGRSAPPSTARSSKPAPTATHRLQPRPWAIATSRGPRSPA